MSDNKKDDSENYVKPPSFLQMVKTFTTEIATYIANGSPNVTTEDYINRLDTCNKCDHFIEKSMRCGKCGCLLQHKAKWKTTKCPIDKWDSQEIINKKLKEENAKRQKDNNTDSSNKI